MTPSWLEILKSELNDTHLHIAGAFAAVILLLHYGLIPVLEPYPWLIPLAWFGLLLFWFLWLIQVVKDLRSGSLKR
jgi:hypothetical protein